MNKLTVRQDQYNIDYSALVSESQLGTLAHDLAQQQRSFDSQASFNRTCKGIIDLWQQHVLTQLETSAFGEFLDKIRAGDPSSIPTSWGGVFIVAHKHPHVEKYLVVMGGHYLALEMHTEKQERIQVREGSGILLRGQGDRRVLDAKPLFPGAVFDFKPGDRHCIIGCRDLLIYETSEDPKGMDRDLVFVFAPEA